MKLNKKRLHKAGVDFGMLRDLKTHTHTRLKFAAEGAIITSQRKGHRLTNYQLAHVMDWRPKKPLELEEGPSKPVPDSPFSPNGKKKAWTDLDLYTMEALTEKIVEIMGDNSEGGVRDGVEVEPVRASSIWIRYALGSRSGKWREIYPYELGRSATSFRALETLEYELTSLQQPKKPEIDSKKSRMEESFEELRIRVEEESRQGRLVADRLNQKMEELHAKIEIVIEAMRSKS